jgi:hypothetical protein
LYEIDTLGFSATLYHCSDSFTKARQCQGKQGNPDPGEGYAIADGLDKLLSPDKTGIRSLPKNKNPDFQLCFSFCDETG